MTVLRLTPLTNRKAKRLARLLKRQSAIAKAQIRLPFVEPLIFLSSTSLTCRLMGLARSVMFLRGSPNGATDDGIVAALCGHLGNASPLAVDGQQARARGLIEAGVRKSARHHQIGDYRLINLLTEGEGSKDWAAQHVSVDTIHRRIRICTFATASSPEARASRVRMAQRESEVLEGIDHPGILKVKDYKDHVFGPARIFDHDPKAVRLDLLLRDRGSQLTIDQRLHLVRSIAETLQYAPMPSALSTAPSAPRACWCKRPNPAGNSCPG